MTAEHHIEAAIKALCQQRDAYGWPQSNCCQMAMDKLYQILIDLNDCPDRLESSGLCPATVEAPRATWGTE